jgi:putative ABC transport system permease protein
MVMNVLYRKLWRTIKGTRGQFLAVVAVVTIGIAVYIGMSTAYYNLDRSQRLFYQENNFADYYFHVVRAPRDITRQVEAIPGVVKATGRIQKEVPVIKEDRQRATARLTSYPLPMEGEVNRLQLQRGRLFEAYPESGGIEVLVDPQYYEANRLSLKNKISIVADGKQVDLTVVGTAISPEAIYTIKDASTLLPDPETFGIIMLPQLQAEQILNLQGEINQIVITMAPWADSSAAAGQIKTILEPYGNLADYPREDQLSHAVLQAELDGLRTLAGFMPLIFLGVAALIQFVMLRRMVRAQRRQIGLMKALGYGAGQIMLHYTGYALAVGLLGALLGTMSGYALAAVMSEAFALYFHLPQAIGGVNLTAICSGFLLALGVSFIAGLTATREVVAVKPAESMRPEAPQSIGRFVLEGWQWLWMKISPAWKMALRAVNRRRGRFAATLLGVVFAVGLLVMSLFFNDAVDYMIKKHFYEEQHYDFLVRFNKPVKEQELLDLIRLEGVNRLEPILEIPVQLTAKGNSAEDVIVGVPPELTLKQITGGSGEPLPPPADGILISQLTAQKLSVRTGDTIELETRLGLGPVRRTEIKITGINRQLVGSSSYISLAQANRILEESGVISGAMLNVDPGKKELVEKNLADITGIASISSLSKELDNFNIHLGVMSYTMALMIFFAVLLGFAIVYNSSLISFAERKREIATLRVVGYTVQEISSLLLKENLLQSLLGVALGLPFGYYLSKWYVMTASTDIYTIPVVIYPQTYLFAALGGIGFILIAHLTAVRGVKRIELVEVLKSTD